MSQAEQVRILQMVRDGVITIDEAEQLLAALDTPEPLPAARKTTHRHGHMPEMQRFRRYWEYPFVAGLIMLGVAGLCASNTPSPLIAFCGWSVFALAALIALIGWFSQWSRWVHVRIREQDGARIAFSLPLPLGLIGIVTDIASVFVHKFANRETAENLELVTSLLTLMDDEPLDEPLVLDIVDEDGDHVQVFVG